MSVNESTKQAKPELPDLRRDPKPGTRDVATYALSLVRGLRQLTRQADSKDLEFLNYLLAIAEDEAANLSSRVYH
jgi:hypothetical protein